MAINDNSEKNNKSITFISNTKEDKYQGESEESLSGATTLVGRKFNKSLRRLDRK